MVVNTGFVSDSLWECDKFGLIIIQSTLAVSHVLIKRAALDLINFQVTISLVLSGFPVICLTDSN